MKTIKDLLSSKGGDVWSVTSTSTVFDAIAMMAEKGVGALMVVDDSRPVGILSERDYARKVILRERSSKDTPVSEIMTSPVIHTSSDRSVQECMKLMTGNKIRHLPVMDNDELTGMVSIGDLVKATIDDQQATIEQLERYIAG